MVKTKVETYDLNSIFVSKAVTLDDTRWFMLQVECQEIDGAKKIIATDGRRLHMADCNSDDMLPDNGYLPIGKPKKNRMEFEVLDGEHPDYQYLNWQRVIPEDFMPGSLDVEFPGNWKKETGKFSIAVAQVYKYLPENKTINIEYLQDLGGYLWTMRVSEKGSSAKFTSDTGKVAVVAFMEIEPKHIGYESPKHPENSEYIQKHVPDYPIPAPEPEPEPAPVMKSYDWKPRNALR